MGKRFMKHGGDPYETTARFNSTCNTCKKPIKKGDAIVYWPNGKTAGHIDCDRISLQTSKEMAWDEEQYAAHYGTGRF
jgi:hypothetical protein